uniref:Kinesin motor domain-containing protein n=1 Tax=Mesocestoides corti TaxID=53468 RepID=A0A5K3FWE5_MESCO
MIVNVAPSVGLADETLHALRFSALASQVIVQSNNICETDLVGEGRAAGDTSVARSLQRQLREQLIRQGLKTRCTGSWLKGGGSRIGESTVVEPGTVVKGRREDSGDVTPTNEEAVEKENAYRESLLPGFLENEVDLDSLEKAV